MADGIVYGMKLRIDRSGRVVLPKTLRSRLGLALDGEFEALERPDGVLLQPLKQEPAMVQVDGLWIHRGKPEPGADWSRMVDEVREERNRDISGW